MHRLLAVAAALLAALPAALVARTGTDPPGRSRTDSCSSCHESQARAADGDVHAGRCVDCHGGDEKAAIKEKAHAGMADSKRPAIPTLCARCHSDPRRMNSYGLSTDQHAQYLTSRHGEALAKGRTDAAVCSDCHLAHGIRRARDPMSPVSPANVPTTCGRCHGDAELMKRHDLPATAPSLYNQSAHARLLKAGDRSAPHCATCHGNHGATPPGFAEVGHVCGKCHVRQLEAFDQSPHAFYAKDGSFKGCIACHGNHEIERETPAIFRRCAICHDAKDPEMKKAMALAADAGTPRAAYERTAARLAAAARSGEPVDDEQLKLEAAHTSLLQIPAAFHTLDPKRLDAVARETQSSLAAVDAGLDAKERSGRLRRWALLPVWIFLVAMAALFWAKRRRLEVSDGT